MGPAAGGSAAGGSAAGGASPGAPTAPDPCAGPSSTREHWRHTRSRITVGLGSPRHSAVDAIVAHGEAVDLEAKFTYGKLGKDLQDENVRLMLEIRCGQWDDLGPQLTDRDGWAKVSASRLPSKAGRYRLRWVVGGDGSSVTAALWVVDAGARLVIFDVDGTLTVGDSELFELLVNGKVPTQHDGAADVAQELARRGYQPVYMTARPYLLAGMTRDWLTRQGFPAGPLRTTHTLSESAPGADVERYKTEALRSLSAGKLQLARAYGNAMSDVCAYAEAGVPASETFIIGPNAGKPCRGSAPSQPLADFVSHLATLKDH